MSIDAELCAQFPGKIDRSLIRPMVAGKTRRAVADHSASVLGSALAFSIFEGRVAFEERMMGF
jgi:phosphatidate phosphatase APP1